MNTEKVAAGVGLSIGTVNSVAAAVRGGHPSVFTRRSGVTIDRAGTVHPGGGRSGTAVTDFADLSGDPEPVVVGGRIWSAANLVAAVVQNLSECVPGRQTVLTYPGGYSDKQVELLRQALDLTGAGTVRLLPEPMAAIAWLEYENDSLTPGFVLVYDLGANSLDITVVRIGTGPDDHAIVGKTLRSYGFGGRPLGSAIARRTFADASDTRLPSTLVDFGELRARHIRDSLDLVRDQVRAAGLSMADIDRILLAGGAVRPPEVAAVLAELGRPVVQAADPGQCVATGAAWYATRIGRSATSAPRQRPWPALVAGAASLSVAALMLAALPAPPGDYPWSPAPTVDRLPDLPSAFVEHPKRLASTPNMPLPQAFTPAEAADSPPVATAQSPDPTQSDGPPPDESPKPSRHSVAVPYQPVNPGQFVPGYPWPDAAAGQDNSQPTATAVPPTGTPEPSASETPTATNQSGQPQPFTLPATPGDAVASGSPAPAPSNGPAATGTSGGPASSSGGDTPSGRTTPGGASADPGPASGPAHPAAPNHPESPSHPGSPAHPSIR
ncbi:MULTISPECIES: Hsp70 family protein [unclassified Nocardia]|uniref:Hsp70 family protein n=1 Tax=unclassified Nocardia TaxID=2637762 RepID=UPI001CE4AF4F|nr:MULTISPECIES: Hsp70 family protein [unclassified Nocardia]